MISLFSSEEIGFSILTLPIYKYEAGAKRSLPDPQKEEYILDETFSEDSDPSLQLFNVIQLHAALATPALPIIKAANKTKTNFEINSIFFYLCERTVRFPSTEEANDLSTPWFQGKLDINTIYYFNHSVKHFTDNRRGAHRPPKKNQMKSGKG